jgi:large subunit ribosomal protein LP1
MSTSELATSYAALILADDGVDITVRSSAVGLCAGRLTNTCQADKLQSLIKAAKIEEVEPIWTTLFAKVRTPL